MDAHRPLKNFSVFRALTAQQSQHRVAGDHPACSTNVTEADCERGTRDAELYRPTPTIPPAPQENLMD